MLRRCQLRSSFIAALATALLALSPCARAGSKVTTSLSPAVTGSFFLNTGDQSSSEWVDFSGDVHLVVQAIPPDPIIPPSPITPPNPIVPINFIVQVGENGIATGALATVGECTTDLGCGD